MGCIFPAGGRLLTSPSDPPWAASGRSFWIKPPVIWAAVRGQFHLSPTGKQPVLMTGLPGPSTPVSQSHAGPLAASSRCPVRTASARKFPGSWEEFPCPTAHLVCPSDLPGESFEDLFVLGTGGRHRGEGSDITVPFWGCCLVWKRMI